MEAVIIAITTAIVSISVALIQAVSALKIAGIKAQPTQEAAPTNRPVTPDKAPNLSRAQPTQKAVPLNRPVTSDRALNLSRTWLWVTGILIVSNFLWQVLRPEESGYMIHLVAIPWCTGLLAYFRPIRWAYVAGVVTLLSIASVVTARFTIPYYYDDPTAISILALVFAANAVVAAGIAYIRQRGPLAR